jgi:hypothetical protein
MLKRPVVCERAQFFHRYGRGAEEPSASLDKPGMHRHVALDTAAFTASWTAKARIGREPLSPARGVDIRSGSGVLRR